MCSCVLSRRLDLPIPDFRLATVAGLWSIPFERQHDALVDARMLAEVLPRLLGLLASIAPGLARDTVGSDTPSAPPVPAVSQVPSASAEPSPVAAEAPVPAAPAVIGDGAAVRPFAVRRVLVLGGPHADAAAIRERVVQAGGLAAVNLTVTEVVCLPGGEDDRRMARIRALGLPVITAETFLRRLDPPSASTPRSTAAVAALDAVPSEDFHSSGGAVTDLPVSAGGDRWAVAATWAWESTVAVDLVAFLVGTDEQVGGDEDFVFYNQPQSDDGAVVLSVDGPSEQAIVVDLAALPRSVHRVVVGAALGDGRTFGEVGPLGVAARTPDGRSWLHATLDAATTEKTLILAELYRRNDAWRFRAVGQGHDHGLVALARSYGVDATD
ncbi:Stress protein [Frankia sp. Hr75.2]|nr:Stress protein [Frankia sp. Hr75.2]